jgi:excisionase family DNA binding protein
MSRAHTGTTFDGLLKGNLPSLPGQGAEFKFTSERLFTSDEAAAYLRVEPRTACLFITSGKLKASKVGRAYLITESALNVFLKEQQKDFPKAE